MNMMMSNANLDSTQLYTDRQWVVDICDTLVTLSAAELDLENSHAVCICEVPESLSCSKREAFIPEFVGLGPYHHFRPGLIMTDQTKLTAARRLLSDSMAISLFQQRISNFGSDVQTFYHPHVISTYNPHTLFYLLTVDALFLLAFITLLSSSNSHAGLGFSYFLTGKLGLPLFNAAGVEFTKNALIREVFKLENQIPFQLLKQVAGVNANEIQSDDMDLRSNVENFCKQHCPLLKVQEIPNNLALEERHHLLDLMYHLIVPKSQSSEPLSQSNFQNEIQAQVPTQSHESESQLQLPSEAQVKTETETVTDEAEIQSKGKAKRTCCSVCFNIFVFLVATCIVLGFIVTLVLKLLLWMISSIFRLVQWVLSSLFGLVQRALRPLCGLLVVLGTHLNPGLRWLHGFLSDLEGKVNHPFLRSLTQAVERLKDITETLQSTDSDEGVRRVVMIPSVVELHQAGIFFQPAESGVASIDFDDEKCVFYLPSLTLDDNSEVIIRNLVAYETLIKSNSPLVFTRYIELMRAIIDTPEDVKVLVDNEIIKSELRDEVIADLFNGMSKSIRPTKTPKLEKVIHKVNAKFDSKQKRKNVVTKYTSGTFLTAVGGLVFLAFTALQTYCTVYNCSGTSKLGKLPQHGDYGTDNYFISSM